MGHTSSDLQITVTLQPARPDSKGVSRALAKVGPSQPTLVGGKRRQDRREDYGIVQVRSMFISFTQQYLGAEFHLFSLQNRAHQQLFENIFLSALLQHLIWDDSRIKLRSSESSLAGKAGEDSLCAVSRMGPNSVRSFVVGAFPHNTDFSIYQAPTQSNPRRQKHRSVSLLSIWTFPVRIVDHWHPRRQQSSKFVRSFLPSFLMNFELDERRWHACSTMEVECPRGGGKKERLSRRALQR